MIDIHQATAELCKRKLSFFVKEFWDVIEEDDLQWSPHMEVMCDEIQKVYEWVIRRERKHYDLIMNVPPGTSKSTIATVMAPAWSWTRDASLRHITFSYSADLSTEHAVKSRDIIFSEKYRRYFPHVQIKHDQNNKTNYKTTQNGQRFATSITGTITGQHGHVLTGDDPLNPKQAASQAELLEAKSFFDKTLPTRKVNKMVTPTILIMQRLATNDPSGHLIEKKKKGVRVVCLPGELTRDVTPEEYRSIYKKGLLDPVRLSRETLDELRIDLGGDGYAGQILQRPVQEGGLLWKKWFIAIDDDIFPSLKSMTAVGTDWDLAYTKDDSNSGSAFIRSGRIDANMFIDGLGAVYFEFPELIAFMRLQRAPHYVENKAPGKSSKQTLTKLHIPAIEVKVEGGKDKIARAKMASPYAEAGMVYIRKSLVDYLYNDPKQGILNFPRGSHTDVADVLAQAIQRIFRGQMISGISKTDSVLDYV
jgi:phage terminase large subunit-like protein